MAPKLDRFRQGVVAVIVNDQNQILMAERSDHPGNWQFPQGGIDGDETPEQAVYREVEEELGNGRIKILQASTGQSEYRWPEAGKKYVGQQHTWFLIRFKKGEEPNLKKSDGCFKDWKWEEPSQILPQIYDWKRAAYEKGFQLLGLVSRRQNKIEELHKKACDQQKDFYIDPETGYQVMTAYFLTKRGHCCESACRHCPYGYKPAAF